MAVGAGEALDTGVGEAARANDARLRKRKAGRTDCRREDRKIIRVV
jgi:hypothetical protein